jgi:hypothetical protein
MPEPASGILGRDTVEGGFELGLKGFASAGSFRFEALFHLGPGLLNRVELG